MARINEGDISADEILRQLKLRIYDKLSAEPYENDMGEWIDPLPAQALGAIGNFVLKLAKFEDERAATNDTVKRVAAIPALPPLTITVEQKI